MRMSHRNAFEQHSPARCQRHRAFPMRCWYLADNRNDVRPIRTPDLINLRAALQENEGRPKGGHRCQSVLSLLKWRVPREAAYMAETAYFWETSLAASTSHLRKLTFLYCFERASKVGAMAWQGPHLEHSLSRGSKGWQTESGSPRRVEVDDLRRVPVRQTLDG